MDEIQKSQQEQLDQVKAQGNNKSSKEAAYRWFKDTIKSGYSYNFSWMGLPIIKYPQDMIAMQEIIWEVKPDIIIETGIARKYKLFYF